MNTKLKGKWAGKREKRENCACECEVSSRKFYFHKNPAFIDFFVLFFSSSSCFWLFFNLAWNKKKILLSHYCHSLLLFTLYLVSNCTINIYHIASAHKNGGFLIKNIFLLCSIFLWFFIAAWLLRLITALEKDDKKYKNFANLRLFAVDTKFNKNEKFSDSILFISLSSSSWFNFKWFTTFMFLSGV
jgi:hypothetical protein